MGMIIRVAFNNQNWAGRCKGAGQDGRLFKCQEGIVDTSYQLDANGNCLANCWESTLCTKYFWESTIGNFGKRAAGNVFFVFPDVNNSLALWGESEVDRVEGSRVYFKPFMAMPSNKWVRNLSPIDILGKYWKGGTWRYLSSNQEDFLLQKISNANRKKR
jgi:hypothetical protein